MERVIDFDSFDIRMIQSMWQTHSAYQIALTLGKPFSLVDKKILEMNQVHRVKLYSPPVTERVVRKGEKEWAKKKLQKHEIKIRVVDTSQLIAVKVNAKTTVYVKPGSDIAAIKKKYDKRPGEY